MEVNHEQRSDAVIAAVRNGGGTLAWSEDADNSALIKAGGVPSAKLTLVQGIAQVAKGTEVPIEAKYEISDGKLMMSIIYVCEGLRHRPEDNSFQRVHRGRNDNDLDPQEGSVRRPQAHRSVGAVSCAACR